jgi:hypothetical protein
MEHDQFEAIRERFDRGMRLMLELLEESQQAEKKMVERLNEPSLFYGSEHSQAAQDIVNKIMRQREPKDDS